MRSSSRGCRQTWRSSMESCSGEVGTVAQHPSRTDDCNLQKGTTLTAAKRAQADLRICQGGSQFKVLGDIAQPACQTC